MKETTWMVIVHDPTRSEGHFGLVLDRVESGGESGPLSVTDDARAVVRMDWGHDTDPVAVWREVVEYCESREWVHFSDMEDGGMARASWAEVFDSNFCHVPVGYDGGVSSDMGTHVGISIRIDGVFWCDGEIGEPVVGQPEAGFPDLTAAFEWLMGAVYRFEIRWSDYGAWVCQEMTDSEIEELGMSLPEELSGLIGTSLGYGCVWTESEDTVRSLLLWCKRLFEERFPGDIGAHDDPWNSRGVSNRLMDVGVSISMPRADLSRWRPDGDEIEDRLPRLGG